jgi:hypothetical protein
MPKTKEGGRKIFEAQLGRKIRANQWDELKQQMTIAQLPIEPKNLKFVAQCKRISPRHEVRSQTLNLIIQAVGKLPPNAYGHEIKAVCFELVPDLNRHKFYKAFRVCGWKFKQETEFVIQDIGDVLYRIFVRRGNV